MARVSLVYVKTNSRALDQTKMRIRLLFLFGASAFFFLNKLMLSDCFLIPNLLELFRLCIGRRRDLRTEG